MIPLSRVFAYILALKEIVMKVFDNFYIFVLSLIKFSLDKYKIFSVEPKEVKDIHFYSATISNNKLLLAVVSNNTDAVHILKCGHASCTSFRSSYKPIADNSKSSIGYGVSINIQRFLYFFFSFIYIQSITSI